MQNYARAMERRQLRDTGLAAARVGSTSTGILLFATASLATWVSVSNSATLGTTIKIRKRGVFAVRLSSVVPAAGAAAFGISLDADAAALLAAANPIVTTAGILAGGHVIAPAATQIPINLQTIVNITDAMAGDDDLGVVRFHGNDGAAGALLAADVVAEQVQYEITQINDLQGS